MESFQDLASEFTPVGLGNRDAYTCGFTSRQASLRSASSSLASFKRRSMGTIGRTRLPIPQSLIENGIIPPSMSIPFTKIKFDDSDINTPLEGMFRKSSPDDYSNGRKATVRASHPTPNPNSLPNLVADVYIDKDELQARFTNLRLPEQSAGPSWLFGFHGCGKAYHYVAEVSPEQFCLVNTMRDMADNVIDRVISQERLAEELERALALWKSKRESLKVMVGLYVLIHSFPIQTSDYVLQVAIYIYFTLPLRALLLAKWKNAAGVDKLPAINPHSPLEIFSTKGVPDEEATLADALDFGVCLKYDMATQETTIFIQMFLKVSKLIEALRNAFRIVEFEEEGKKKKGMAYQKTLGGWKESVDVRKSMERVKRWRRRKGGELEAESSDDDLDFFGGDENDAWEDRRDPFFVLAIILRQWINIWYDDAYRAIRKNTTWLNKEVQEFIASPGADLAVYADLTAKLHVTQRYVSQIDVEISEASIVFDTIVKEHNDFLKFTSMNSQASVRVSEQLRQLGLEIGNLELAFWEEMRKVKCSSDWLSTAMSLRNTQAIRITSDTISKIAQETKKIAESNSKESEIMTQIAVSTQRDGQSMKVIAILSMIFLPGSFVSSVFGWSIISFEISRDGTQTLIISTKGLFIFLIFFFLFTTVTVIGCWIWISNSQKRLTRNKAKKDRINADEKELEK
ncbi:hypothetical protein TWF730_009098 [Orbilia blumenaviensis]|uniref:Uncharacterized protein n=1 Tax=Orbilia blumenaviensis TaxID=1796055 RepID=A0AAV9UXB6_9PEZI